MSNEALLYRPICRLILGYNPYAKPKNLKN